MDMHGSIGKVDAAVRCTVAGSAILAVLISPAVPQWFAILATYPVFTAMVGFDPVVNGIGRALNVFHLQGSAMWTRGAVH